MSNVLYAVMAAQKWSSMSVGNFKLSDEEDENGVIRFIPLFSDKEKAEKFADGKFEVAKLILGVDESNER